LRPQPGSAASDVTLAKVGPGFTGAPAGDPGRLFIVEKAGLIKVLDVNTGQVLEKRARGRISF